MYQYTSIVSTPHCTIYHCHASSSIFTRTIICGYNSHITFRLKKLANDVYPYPTNITPNKFQIMYTIIRRKKNLSFLVFTINE